MNGAGGLERQLRAAQRLAQREADLAREVGVPPWKLRTLRDQSRGWSDAGIARAVRAVAQADADIKGQAHDASYTLERLVLTASGGPFRGRTAAELADGVPQRLGHELGRQSKTRAPRRYTARIRFLPLLAPQSAPAAGTQRPET